MSATKGSGLDFSFVIGSYDEKRYDEEDPTVSSIADWVIDADHLDTNQTGRGRGERVLCVVPFRIYDDDGKLYFEGRMSERTLDGSEELAFDVLSYYTAWAGATRLDYMKNGGWQTL
jgi:hypothetical protein